MEHNEKSQGVLKILNSIPLQHIQEELASLGYFFLLEQAIKNGHLNFSEEMVGEFYKGVSSVGPLCQFYIHKVNEWILTYGMSPQKELEIENCLNRLTDYAYQVDPLVIEQKMVDVETGESSTLPLIYLNAWNKSTDRKKVVLDVLLRWITMVPAEKLPLLAQDLGFKIMQLKNVRVPSVELDGQILCARTLAKKEGLLVEENGPLPAHYLIDTQLAIHWNDFIQQGGDPLTKVQSQSMWEILWKNNYKDRTIRPEIEKVILGFDGQSEVLENLKKNEWVTSIATLRGEDVTKTGYMARLRKQDGASFLWKSEFGISWVEHSILQNPSGFFGLIETPKYEKAARMSLRGQKRHTISYGLLSSESIPMGAMEKLWSLDASLIEKGKGVFPEIIDIFKENIISQDALFLGMTNDQYNNKYSRDADEKHIIEISSMDGFWEYPNKEMQEVKEKEFTKKIYKLTKHVIEIQNGKPFPRLRTILEQVPSSHPHLVTLGLYLTLATNFIKAADVKIWLDKGADFTLFPQLFKDKMKGKILNNHHDGMMIKKMIDIYLEKQELEARILKKPNEQKQKKRM